MSWNGILMAANTVALVSWIVLVAMPRTEVLKALVFYVGIGLLCLSYGVLLVLILGGIVDGGELDGAAKAGFTSIEGVRAIFLSDGGVALGWIHYLAFDLFVGMWIARDGDAKHLSRLLQAPVLLLTFVAGPLGLLLWLVIREPAARRATPRRNRLKR